VAEGDNAVQDVPVKIQENLVIHARGAGLRGCALADIGGLFKPAAAEERGRLQPGDLTILGPVGCQPVEVCCGLAVQSEVELRRG
jgi:hypothetical protein